MSDAKALPYADWPTCRGKTKSYCAVYSVPFVDHFGMRVYTCTGLQAYTDYRESVNRT